MQLSVANPDQRSDEILQSICGMFAEKGFDGASMQDLARAAGMSVGNFYRYFPSKAAIVEAIVNLKLKEIAADFAEIMDAPDEMTAVRAKLHERINSDFCGHDGPLWAEMNAAAFRKPEIAQATQRMEASISRFLLTVFARATGQSDADTARHFSGHMAFIMLLVKSAATTSRIPDANQIALRELILRAIDGVLSEIADSAPKG